MMEEYTIAYAKGELDCNGSRNTCPCEDKKITTGELCLGSIRSNSSDIGWYHWTCTPDRIIRDIKSEYSRPEDMDGYSDLEEEDMERIKRAWKYDHILEIEKPEPYMKQQPRKEEDQVVAESEEMHSNMQDQNDSRQKKQHNHQSSKTVSSVHSTTTSSVPPHEHVKSSSRYKSAPIRVPPHKPVKTSPARVMTVRAAGNEYNLPST